MATDNTAYTSTGGDIFTGFLQSILSSTVPGAGGLAPLLSPFLQQYLGTGTTFGAPLASNMTGAGIFQQTMGNMAGAMGSAASSEFTQLTMADTLGRMQRAMLSQEAWKKQAIANGQTYLNDYSAEELQNAYNLHIDRKVQGIAGNPLASMTYAMLNRRFNIDGNGQAAPYVAAAVSNIARHGLAAGTREYMAYGGDLVNSLFTTESGAFRFRSGEWNGFSSGAIAGIAAAVTRDIDILKGVDLNSSGSLKAASDRFRDLVKSYSEALEPLKDVFGNNMQAMLTSLEAMTGQSLSAAGPSRIATVAAELANRSLMGGYSMKDLSALNGAVSSLLSSTPGIGNTIQMQSADISMNAMDMMSGPLRASWMTNAAWKASATRNAFNTGTSPAVKMFALSRALWLERMTAGLTDSEEDRRERARLMDPDTYRQALMAEAGDSGDLQGAALRLGRVSSVYDLDRGYQSLHYRDGLGMGQDVAALGHATEVGRDLVLGLRNSGQFRADSGMSIGKLYSGIIARLEADPALLDSTDEDVLVSGLGGGTVGRDRLRLLNVLRNNDDFNGALTTVLQSSNLQSQTRRSRAISARRERIGKINRQLFDSDQGLIGLLGDADLSFSGIRGRIAQVLGTSQQQLAAGDESIMNDMAALLSAGGSLGAAAGLDQKETASLSRDLYSYGLSPKGMNKGFRKALAAFTALQQSGADASAIADSAAVLQAYSVMDASFVQKFLKSEDENGVSRSTQLAAFYRNTEGGLRNTAKLRGFMSREIIESAIENDAAYSGDMRNLLDSYVKEHGDDFSDWAEFVKTRKTALTKENKSTRALDTLNDLVLNSVAGSGSSGFSTGNDMMKLLTDALTQLNTYLKKLIGKDNNGV